MTPHLILENLHLRFDARSGIEDVSLMLAPGEVVCLLGPSGCGKSTTLRIAAGVERQSSGRVIIEGQTVSDDTHHAPPEARSVGLLFQDFALFPHLSVAENIAFGLPPRRRRADGAQIAAQYLARVGLDGYAKRYPHQLSGGEQQRVALARALAPRPRVMLMDEPFSGLDNRLREAVRDETLALLKAEGTSVLLVTHEPEEAMRLGDRIALMRAGRIVQTGAPDRLYNHPVDRAAAAFFSDVNVLEAVVRAGVAETPFGQFAPPDGVPEGSTVEIVARPQHLRIVEDVPGTRPLITPLDGTPVRARVTQARFVGSESLIEAVPEHGGPALRASVPFTWLPEPGTPVWLSLRRAQCFVFAGPEAPHAAPSLAAE
ncbi:MAG: ABC transporter ATP-binding protein [Pseudomonadota bacterium]